MGGSLYFLARFADWRQFTRPPVWLLGSLLGLVFLEMAARAVRLRRAAVRVAAVRPSFFQAVWINALGDVVGAMTPSSVGGEVSRLAGLARVGMAPKKAFQVIVAERVALAMTLAGVAGLALGFMVWRAPQLLDLPSLRQVVLVYGGAVAAVAVLVIAFSRYRKANHRQVAWRQYLSTPDLLALALVHHLVRLGLLPLIVAMLTAQVPSPVIVVWSFVLSYGIALLPVPSGGGAVEVTFMTVLEPLLGGHTTESLLLWRLSGYYLYLVLGALVVPSGLIRFRARKSADEGAPTVS